jgi:hypothetical protein
VAHRVACAAANGGLLTAIESVRSQTDDQIARLVEERVDAGFVRRCRRS